MPAPQTPPSRPQRICWTIDEAAGLTGFHRSHIYKLIRTGQLRSVKLGRSRRIPASELDRLFGAPTGGGAA